MKKWSGLFLILFLAWAAAAQAGSSQGWILTQKNAFDDKESQTFISPAGVKATSMGMTTILSARENKIYVLNEEKKQYSESTFEEWMKRLTDMKNLTESFAGEETREEVGKEKIAGMNTVKYRVETKGGDLSIPGVDLKALGMEEEMKMPDTSTEMWVTNDISVSPQLMEFMQGMGGAKSKIQDNPNGIVLRLVSMDEEGKPTTIIDTLKCDKARIDDATFAVPAGFTKVEGFLGIPIGAEDLKMPAPEGEEND